MPKSRFLLVVAVAVGVIGCALPAICAESHAGPFLRMGVGARALGMGGAFTAIADDATAAYWNPAGLTKIENIEVTFMYAANMSVDRQLNYFAYTQWLGVGGLGLSWLNAGMMDMPERDGDGHFINDRDYADNAIMLSYGMEVGTLMLGATAKVLHQSVMDKATETGFGLDFGGMFNLTDNVSTGLMIRDIGSNYNGETVPVDWRVGTAVKALDGGLTIGLDLTKIQDIKDFDINLGAEYGMEVHPGYHAFFRTGVRSVEDKAFTAGMGIRVPFVQFDYSFVSEKEGEALGDNHRVSLTARF